MTARVPPSYNAYLSMLNIQEPKTTSAPSSKEDAKHARAIKQMLNMVSNAERGNTRLILLAEVYTYLEAHLDKMLLSNPSKWTVFSASVYLKSIQLMEKCVDRIGSNEVMAHLEQRLLFKCARMVSNLRTLLPKACQHHVQAIDHAVVRKAMNHLQANTRHVKK